MKKIACIVLGMFFICAPCLAETTGKGPLSGMEFLTGYTQAKLIRSQGDYQTVPLMADFDFDMKTWFKDINYPGLLQFQIEPCISTVVSPDPNIEAGNAFAVKFGFLPETSKFQPYMKIAGGFLYMSQHTREQSTQFNFFEYGSMGAHYFFNDKTGITIEGRFRHLSNAGIREPNHGINSVVALIGLIRLF